MTGKVCSHHKDRRKKILRRCCAGLLIFNFILLIIILIIWAILQPKKPQFVLQDATVYALNISAPNFLTTTISLTISSRNPNHMIGIYYDKLDVYASYRNQQITYYTSILPTYQGHKDINVWSPYIVGNNVPVAPDNGIALTQDASDGTLTLFIKIQGRVRWKVGSFTSGKYHFYVNCPALINIGSQNTGIAVVNAIKFQLFQSCRVSV